jgi:hypothetical protein
VYSRLSTGSISGERQLVNDHFAVFKLFNCFPQRASVQVLVEFIEESPTAWISVVTWTMLNVLHVSKSAFDGHYFW